MQQVTAPLQHKLTAPPDSLILHYSGLFWLAGSAFPLSLASPGLNPTTTSIQGLPLNIACTTSRPQLASSLASDVGFASFPSAPILRFCFCSPFDKCHIFTLLSYHISFDNSFVVTAKTKTPSTPPHDLHHCATATPPALQTLGGPPRLTRLEPTALSNPWVHFSRPVFENRVSYSTTYE